MTRHFFPVVQNPRNFNAAPYAWNWYGYPSQLLKLYSAVEIREKKRCENTLQAYTNQTINPKVSCRPDSTEGISIDCHVEILDLQDRHAVDAN